MASKKKQMPRGLLDPESQAIEEAAAAAPRVPAALGALARGMYEANIEPLLSPVQTARGLLTAGREFVRDPAGTVRSMAQAEGERLQQAGERPESAFEYYGGLLSPFSMLRRAPTMSRVAEYDIRFDPRVEEQERLKALVPNVESRGTVNPPEVSIAEFEGRPFITTMSDRTAAGGLLRGVNDVEFRRPVNLQGGQDFMFENPGMVWASGKKPTEDIMELAREIKSATGEDPLYIPWRMAPTGGDFASMTGETMLNYADVSLSKAARKAADAEISKFIPNWAGIGTDESIQQFRSAKDSIRKAIKNKLDVKFRNEGGLNIGEARLAVADPRQYTAPGSGIQNVGIIRPDESLIMQSGHPAYPFGVPGEGIGRVKEDVRIFELLEDAAKARGIANPREPLRPDTRSLEMKPYSGRITPEILKRLGL